MYTLYSINETATVNESKAEDWVKSQKTLLHKNELLLIWLYEIDERWISEKQTKIYTVR